MTFTEVAQTIFRELNMSKPKIRDIGNHFCSLVKKTRRYPLIRHETFMSRDKTTFHITFTANKRNDWNNPQCFIFVPFHRNDGINVANPDISTGATIFFTKHFIDRYRERVLGEDDMPPVRVAEQFLHRNPGVVIRPSNNEFIRTFDRYEEISQGKSIVGSTREGYCFGDKIAHKVIVIRTFITQEMLHEDQSEIFARLRGALEMIEQRPPSICI